MAKKTNRMGERNIMKCGYWCEIVEYKDANNITVQFDESKYITNTSYRTFKNGRVEDKLQPTVYGKGITGNVKTSDKTGKHTKPYARWMSMMSRCYGKQEGKDKSYVDCNVCDEWLYYPNFKKWYEDNYYEIDSETMCLDKDILIKGNRTYSPEACIFVPNTINLTFTKASKSRGDFPIGVSKKANGGYRANIYETINGKRKQKQLGTFITPEDAFNSYKLAKEQQIKELADKYKSKIPQRLYNAMYEYKVEIND